jgi:predicted RNase H-related nuclease YkuK (DUF458 family)
MLDKVWTTMEGKAADVLDTLRSHMSSTEDGQFEVHVGTDSQQAGNYTEFVAVIVLLNKGKGGRAFYTRERTPRVKSLRERLMKEVWMSLQVGMQLNAVVPETVGLTIHVDANPDVQFRSSDHVKELVGMVAGQGFKTLTKPDSWAATHVADHVVKHKVLHM